MLYLIHCSTDRLIDWLIDYIFRNYSSSVFCFGSSNVVLSLKTLSFFVDYSFFLCRLNALQMENKTKKASVDAQQHAVDAQNRRFDLLQPRLHAEPKAARSRSPRAERPKTRSPFHGAPHYQETPAGHQASDERHFPADWAGRPPPAAPQQPHHGPRVLPRTGTDSPPERQLFRLPQLRLTTPGSALRGECAESAVRGAGGIGDDGAAAAHPHTNSRLSNAGFGGVWPLSGGGSGWELVSEGGVSAELEYSDDQLVAGTAGGGSAVEGDVGKFVEVDEMETTWEVWALSLWFDAISIEDWPVQSLKKRPGEVLFSVSSWHRSTNGKKHSNPFFWNFNKSKNI